MTTLVNEKLATCAICGTAERPSNPDDPPYQWKLPEGWGALIPELPVRHICPHCSDSHRYLLIKKLMTPERISHMLDLLKRFWEKQPERQFSEIVALIIGYTHFKVLGHPLDHEIERVLIMDRDLSENEALDPKAWEGKGLLPRPLVEVYLEREFGPAKTT